MHEISIILVYFRVIEILQILKESKLDASIYTRLDLI